MTSKLYITESTLCLTSALTHLCTFSLETFGMFAHLFENLVVQIYVILSDVVKQYLHALFSINYYYNRQQFFGIFDNDLGCYLLAVYNSTNHTEIDIAQKSYKYVCNMYQIYQKTG